MSKEGDIIYSEVESKRFGLKVYRLSADLVNYAHLKKQIVQERADIVFLRMGVAQKGKHAALFELPFQVLHADTLNYYSVNIEQYQPKSLRNELRFEQITRSNSHHLDELVPEIFKGYQNHYFSNVHLDQADIVEGYVEWAKSYISESDSRISWYVLRDSDIIGFATCKYDEGSRVSEGVLYGVKAAHSGGGVYTDIIRFTQEYFRKLGYAEMLVSTQVQNFAVQKVWVREGFFLKEAFDTYHINSFLSSSKFGSKTLDYDVSDEEIEAFAAFSKDRNNIHFDDSFARENGFKGRISHGMIYESKLSYVLGNIFPGPGTIIIRQETSFTAPIYPNEKYTWSVRCFEKKDNGFQKICSTVESEDGKIAIVSYSDVIRRN